MFSQFPSCQITSNRKSKEFLSFHEEKKQEYIQMCEQKEEPVLYQNRFSPHDHLISDPSLPPTPVLSEM